MTTPDYSKDNKIDLDSLLPAHNPRFVQLLDEARRRVQTSGGISLADFRRQLEADDDTSQSSESETPQ